MKRNPQIQKPQSRDDAPHRPVGGIDRERGKLQKKRVPVPEKPGPRRITNRQPDIHPQQHPQKQLGPLQPPRNPLRRMPRALRIAPSPSRVPRNRLIPVSRHEPSRRPRQWSRARGKRRRCQFRLLGHSLATRAAPDSHSIANIRHRPGNPGPAQGRRIATVSQQPPQAEELGTSPKPPDTRGLDGTLPGIFPPLGKIDRTTPQNPVKLITVSWHARSHMEHRGTETEDSAPVPHSGLL